MYPYTSSSTAFSRRAPDCTFSRSSAERSIVIVNRNFDLFSDDEIDRGLLRHVRRAFPEAEVLPLINNADELTTLVNGVKVSFLT
jgi:hypothetical protein